MLRCYVVPTMECRDSILSQCICLLPKVLHFLHQRGSMGFQFGKNTLNILKEYQWVGIQLNPWFRWERTPAWLKRVAMSPLPSTSIEGYGAYPSPGRPPEGWRDPSGRISPVSQSKKAFRLLSLAPRTFIFSWFFSNRCISSSSRKLKTTPATCVKKNLSNLISTPSNQSWKMLSSCSVSASIKWRTSRPHRW